MPLTGKKKTVLWVAVIGGGAAGLYLYIRHQQKASAATTATAQPAPPNGTAYGYGSGAYGYGSGAYGYGSAAGMYGYGYGGYEGPGSGMYGYGYYGAGTSQPGSSAVTTNAQWSEAAVSALTAQGFSGETVLAALGVYLTGGQLSAQQVQIIQSAIAAEGYPPTAGAGGYPPAMHTGGTTGTGNGGSTVTGSGGAASMVTVPDVMGQDLVNAQKAMTAAGLKSTASGPSFTGAKKGSVRKVEFMNPQAGKSVPKGTTVTLGYYIYDAGKLVTK